MGDLRINIQGSLWMSERRHMRWVPLDSETVQAAPSGGWAQASLSVIPLQGPQPPALLVLLALLCSMQIKPARGQPCALLSLPVCPGSKSQGGISLVVLSPGHTDRSLVSLWMSSPWSGALPGPIRGGESRLRVPIGPEVVPAVCAALRCPALGSSRVGLGRP